MKSDNTRHIAVKSLFRADEFTEFRAACEDSDVPLSRQLRDLARWWTEWRKVTRQSGGTECPEPVQNMGMFPAFRGGTPFPQLV